MYLWLTQKFSTQALNGLLVTLPRCSAWGGCERTSGARLMVATQWAPWEAQTETQKSTHCSHWFSSWHALLSPQTWFLGSCRAQPIWRHGKSKECSKAPIAIQTSTSLITTSQGCLLSLLAVPYLLVRDSIIHAMLIAGILGYLCQANCCGIAVFMLS